MTRDWRKVALAVLTAAALASVYSLDTSAQSSKQPAKTAKKSPPAEDKPAEENAAAPAKKKKQDPVEAQRAIENAHKLLQGGKAEQAVQALTATLSVGNLPPALMAKALYLRGIAQRQQSKPALAISDLTSALWLKGGLAEADRTEAVKQRAAAYSDAGLTETGEPAPASPGGKERQASSKSWGATTSPDAGSGSSQGTNWFNNLFGIGQATPTPASNPPPSPPPPPVTASITKSDPSPPAAQAAPEPPPRVSTAWSSRTRVKAEKADNVAAVEQGPAPAAGKFQGRFRVQLATVRSEQEARALATKAKRELAAALAAREPEIDQAVLGNMGSFYRVRVGPFATMQETEAVCAKVKGTGFDCMAVTQ